MAAENWPACSVTQTSAVDNSSASYRRWISLLLKRSSPTSSHAPKALGVRKSSTA